MPINEKTQRYDTPCTYTVKEKSNLNNRMYEEGETVSYDGMPAENLTPTDAEGEARYQDYLTSNKARIELMKAQFSETDVGDASKFAQALAAELAKSKAETDAQMATLTDAIAKLTAVVAAGQSPKSAERAAPAADDSAEPMA